MDQPATDDLNAEAAEFAVVADDDDRSTASEDETLPTNDKWPVSPREEVDGTFDPNDLDVEDWEVA